MRLRNSPDRDDHSRDQGTAFDVPEPMQTKDPMSELVAELRKAVIAAELHRGREIPKPRRKRR